MKKSILNLGKSIEKAEQKQINGGYGNCGWNYGDACAPGGCCIVGQCRMVSSPFVWRCV